MSLDKQPPSPHLLLEAHATPPRFSAVREIWLFVRATGKWWLLPVLVALLLLGMGIVLSASGYAPFLYTLF